MSSFALRILTWLYYLRVSDGSLWPYQLLRAWTPAVVSDGPFFQYPGEILFHNGHDFHQLMV